jgi:hypothetical protein
MKSMASGIRLPAKAMHYPLERKTSNYMLQRRLKIPIFS